MIGLGDQTAAGHLAVAKDADAGSAGVRLSGISMVYSNGKKTMTAIEDVSGVIPPARFVSVIGPSGCGKSTMLDILCGLQQPTTGTVELDGRAVTGPQAGTSMVFQEDSTLHWRTVLDNVALGLQVRGMSKQERYARARDMIALVGLRGFESHRPRQLSGGMKQRVAIARSLAVQPEVLLMDEPFGALDQQTRWFVGQELTRIWEATRNIVVFVTHDIPEAVLLSDEVWVLSARPSTVKEVVTIDLPRPRREDVQEDLEFQKYVGHLWSILRPEVKLGRGEAE